VLTHWIVESVAWNSRPSVSIATRLIGRTPRAPATRRIEAGAGGAGRGRSREAYIEGALESGDFPNIARFGSAAIPALDDQDALFETGLEWLLAGIAASA
jgi:tetracycline repressor-like protein